MLQSAAWKPLLSTEEAVPYRSLLVDLAEALWQIRGELTGGLSSGPAGVALFLAHLSKLEGFSIWRDRAFELLETAVAGIGDLHQSSLYAGYTGVAWTVEHLQSEVFGADSSDLNAEVDEILLDHLQSGLWRGPYDLVSGLVGYGVYALARAHRPSGRALLTQILRHLEAMAVRTGPGVAWLSREPESYASGIPMVWRERWNLGVAHGIPGVLGLLASMAELDIGDGRAECLYDAGLVWLRSRIQPEPFSGLAPWQEANEADPRARRGRVAWCYGDLGASVVLLGAARRLDRWSDAAMAVDLGRRAAARPMAEAGIKDACLCHGSFGNAHLFARLHASTAEPCFREASRAAYQDGMARRQAGCGLAGFTHALPPVQGLRASEEQEAAPGLLEGAAGIGLALVAALSDHEPTWDRFLLPA